MKLPVFIQKGWFFLICPDLKTGFWNALILSDFPKSGHPFYQYGLLQLIHTTGNYIRYMMKLYLRYLFRNHVLSYCLSIERRRREPKYTFWKYYTMYMDISVRQEYEFVQKLTVANLAKVFRITFAKWILPSPLAKCEGLCASLHSWIQMVLIWAKY